MAAMQRDQAVPKMFEDRVRADAEVVSHALDPDRTPDKVKYPDPRAPNTEGQTAPDSIADIQMARRTDAGQREAEITAPRSSSSAVWIGLGVLVVIALAIMAFL